MDSLKEHIAKLTWRFLPLTRGKSAIVDADRFDDLRGLTWHAFFTKGRVYAKRYVSYVNGKQNELFMHRHLLGLRKGDPLFGEHINGNGLDNRLSNLRLATNSQNQANRPMSRMNSSGYKGVSWHKVKKLWIVSMRFQGKRMHLGYFPEDKILEAAMAYKIAAAKYFGEFAYGEAAK